MSTPSLPPSWYPDPAVPGQLRWWDGARWTDEVRRAEYPVLNAGPTGTRYAGFWERFLAFLLDSLIVFVPLGALGVILFDESFLDIVIWTAISLAVNAAYFIGMLAKYSRTVGQRALSIRVVTEDGSMPSLDAAAKRWLLPGGLSIFDSVPFLNIVTGLVVVIDFLSMLWDKENQCWHDKFARTWMVHERDQPVPVTSYP